MKHEYPTGAELKRIREWPHNDHAGLAAFVGSIWWFPEWGFNLTGKRIKKLELHTAGWSGNEDIVDALGKNFMFWGMCWKESRRGGHYKFEIRELKK